MVRLRHRYLTVELEFQNHGKKSFLSNRNPSYLLLSAINKSIKNLHGSKGLAESRSSLLVNYLNLDTGIAFIRMRRSSYDMVSSSIPLVTSIDGEPVSIKTLHTAATIRHSSLFLQKYQRKALLEKYSSITSEAERLEFQQELQKISKSSKSLINLIRPVPRPSTSTSPKEKKMTP